MPHKLSSCVMQRQINKTACWLSVAHFCLEALEVPVAPLNSLANQWQTTSGSSNAMDGAGNPLALIKATSREAASPQAYDTKGMKFDKASPTRDQIDKLVALLQSGYPVIGKLESAQVGGWKHAIVLYEATRNGADVIFKYKDPAKEDANNGISISADLLFDTGFQYHGAAFAATHNGQSFGGTNVYAYCSAVSYMVEAP